MQRVKRVKIYKVHHAVGGDDDQRCRSCQIKLHQSTGRRRCAQIVNGVLIRVDRRFTLKIQQGAMKSYGAAVCIFNTCYEGVRGAETCFLKVIKKFYKISMFLCC